MALVRAGDWVVIALAVVVVVASFPFLWRGGPAERVVVRLDGHIVGEYPLTAKRRVDVAGPLGTTVVEVEPGRARVLSDPGPRQYCVKQGWLSRANAVAICAPNHVSVALVGRTPGYDSITF